MLKFYTILILFIILRESSYAYTYLTRALVKTVTTGNSKPPCSSTPKPKIAENLKNILGAGGRRKPNIFPITT